MAGVRAETSAEDLGFLLVPNFSLMSYASAIEPLRQANRLAERPLYRWHLYSCDGEPVRASNGVAILPDANAASDIALSTVVVCAGLEVAGFRNRASFAWLRRMAREGAQIGGICTGSLVLARAGLLRGYRCTIHWENRDAFREEFPDLDVTESLYEIDRDRFTCSGGIAALDLMHEIIRRDHGAALSTAVSEQFMHTHVRLPGDPQRMAVRARLGIRHGRLIKVLEHMEANLEEPLSREQLAELACLSVRQLERLCRTYLGRTPGQHYLDLRLERARLLLRQTSMSILQVAVACGFVNASHFSIAFRRRFGHSPRAER